LALNQLVFVVVELALRFENRQEIDETCSILLGGKIHCQLVLFHCLVKPIPTLLFLRIIHQGILHFFQSLEDSCLVADQGPTLTRGLHSDVGANPPTVEQRQTDPRAYRKEVARPQCEIAKLSGLAPRRAGQDKARKQICFRLSDPGRGRC